MPYRINAKCITHLAIRLPLLSCSIMNYLLHIFGDVAIKVHRNTYYWQAVLLRWGKCFENRWRIDRRVRDQPQLCVLTK